MRQHFSQTVWAAHSSMRGIAKDAEDANKKLTTNKMATAKRFFAGEIVFILISSVVINTI